MQRDHQQQLGLFSFSPLSRGKKKWWSWGFWKRIKWGVFLKDLSNATPPSTAATPPPLSPQHITSRARIAVTTHFVIAWVIIRHYLYTSKVEQTGVYVQICTYIHFLNQSTQIPSDVFYLRPICVRDLLFPSQSIPEEETAHLAGGSGFAQVSLGLISPTPVRYIPVEHHPIPTLPPREYINPVIPPRQRAHNLFSGQLQAYDPLLVPTWTLHHTLRLHHHRRGRGRLHIVGCLFSLRRRRRGRRNEGEWWRRLPRIHHNKPSFLEFHLEFEVPSLPKLGPRGFRTHNAADLPHPARKSCIRSPRWPLSLSAIFCKACKPSVADTYNHPDGRAHNR